MTKKALEEKDEAQRRGEEADLQEELREVDEKVGERILDRPYSEDRRERRRGQFIDLHGDEDGDYQTRDITRRSQHGHQDASVDSMPPTTSTSSTPSTTSPQARKKVDPKTHQ